MPFFPLFSAVLLAVSSTRAAFIVPSQSRSSLVLENKVVSPDGFSRVAVTVNGKFPSPIISANKGDNFQINVVNKLTDKNIPRATSVHFHGLFMVKDILSASDLRGSKCTQDQTSWADGAAFVTQCPISPSHSFSYDFTPKGQAGTFWYHSHLQLQYCDGLRGPLIIYDPRDPYQGLYDVDDESTVVTLGDWLHFTSRNLPFPPIFDTTLVNGLGRFAGGPLSPLAVISVKKGLRYRFRLLNIACDPDFVFGIQGHSMTVIEADGVLTQARVVDSIHIHVGQRYSFVLNADQKIDNYWIRAIPNYVLSFVMLAPPVKDPANPNLLLPSNKPLKEADLAPFIPTPVPGVRKLGAADVSLNLAIDVDVVAQLYTIGGATFTPPSVPVLLQILSGAQTAQQLLPKGSFYTLPKNKVIEISIPGASDPAASQHPFHLHGHNFHVIRSAGTTNYNFINPPVRDVVNIGTGAAKDNVTIRFATDNDGPWILHCHVDFHLNAGLAVVLVEDAPTIRKESIPKAWNDLCPIYNALPASEL
ncbi:Laccase I [Mycena indigotica]|uniref:Laccase I n=1 Tax=Mycena indigotica TaxID=2126181 RepID=A0A8H6W387_9AGAR|nr:Laccase I [Mycena indigotica]KAF7303974.1 Laccase I [Mycena indigotica]